MLEPRKVSVRMHTAADNMGGLVKLGLDWKGSVALL